MILYLIYGFGLPCQSHISNIKSFLPVEAEITVTKVFITAKFQELIMKVKSSIKKGWCVFVIILYLNNVSSSSKHNHLVFV
jgi:hypothetical protein